MSIHLPYSRPEITESDIRAVVESLSGQFLTQGPQIQLFEAELQRKLGAKHAVVCNSGTAALHLAYLALELGVNRGLMTAPITFLATANAARMCNAPVVFSDVDPMTGNITPQLLRDALDDCQTSIAAATVIHVGGRPCHMPGLRKVANESGIALIEDACHAPLALYFDENAHPYHVGACAHSDMAVLSFHAIKHIAMGEGGAVMTNDDALAERLRIYRNHGMIKDLSQWKNAPESDAPWYYEMHDVGWNYRACEMQCALGLSQLGRLEDGIRRRRELAKQYDVALGGMNHVSTPTISEGNVWHLYPVAIDFEAVGKTRGQVMKELATRGIGTQVHYIPVNKQPYYQGYDNALTPGADAYYNRTLSIPMYPGMSDADVLTVVGGLRSALSA